LTSKRILLGAALTTILSAASLSAGRFVPADAQTTAAGRYRVTLDTTRIDDADAAVSQLLSICRCRVEPYAEEGFTGFLISATPSAARMLSSDPRVSAVEELVSEAAAVIPSVERGTWAGGATAPAPRTEPAPMAAPHNPVSNAGITAWDTGTYTYDGSGNIRSIGTTQIYTYDLYGRLAYGKVQASRFQRFSYDRFGNLLNTTTNNDTPPTPQTISGVSNRLSSGGATYDAAGRMLTGTGVAFRYDGDGMPTWSQMAAGSVTQTKVQIYSATDERIASLWIGPANGSDWTIRDAGGQVLRRLHKSTSGQWSWQEDYVYRDGQMLASEVATREKTLHYHLDHLGTPRLITGNGGAQVALHTYDPFGAEVTVAGQAGTEPIKKFTGHERDTANVDYMLARYYQNGWGRFLSVDPTWESADLGNPESWNRYAYVRSNPINATDPDGRVLQTANLTTIQDLAGSAGSKVTVTNGNIDVSQVTAADRQGNEGAQLVYELATSQNVYSYSEGNTINTAAGQRGLGTEAVVNLDNNADSRYRNGKAAKDKPAAGVDCVVAIDPTKPYFDQATRTLPVAHRAVAFHELAEAYAKVDGGLQYLPQGSQPGAHDVAAQREKVLLQQRPNFTQFPAGGLVKR
jgi:RHS repeat-associated protein